MALADLLPALAPTPGLLEEDEEARRIREAEEQAAGAPLAPLQVTDSTTGGGGAPVEAASPAAPMVYQPPEESIRVEGGQSTTRRTKMAPERVAEIRAQRQAGADVVEAKTLEGEAAVGKQDNAAQQADAEAKLKAQEARDLLAARQEHDKLIAAKQGEYEKRRQQLEKDAKITTYWQDRGAPAEIFAVFITGLSDYSHQVSGGEGPSPVQRMFDQKIAEDGAVKMHRFETSKEFLELAKKDVDAARAAKAAKAAEIKDQHVVMADALAKRFKAYAEKIGTTETAAKSEREVAELKQKNAETLAGQLKDADEEVSYTGPKTTTTVNVNKGAVVKPPLPDEVRERKGAEQSAERTEDLAGFIASNPKAWEEYRQIYGLHANADTIKNIPYVGGAARLAIGMASKLPLPGVREVRPSVDDAISGIKDPKLREAVVKIHAGMERQVTDTAKLSSKNPSDTELAAARSQLAIVGRTPKEMAEALRKKSSDVRDTSAAVEANDASKAQTQPKNDALSRLIAVRSGGDKAAIDRAVRDAEAAGVRRETIEALLQDAKRRGK